MDTSRPWRMLLLSTMLALATSARAHVQVLNDHFTGRGATGSETDQG